MSKPEYNLSEQQREELLEAARSRHCSGSDNECEVDDAEELSVAENHVWVKGWFYVPAEDLSKETRRVLGIEPNYDAVKVACGNCNWNEVWTEDEVIEASANVPDFYERTDEDSDEEPAGVCPECGALIWEQKEEE